jgi:hypothetical protein
MTMMKFLGKVHLRDAIVEFASYINAGGYGWGRRFD